MAFPRSKQPSNIEKNKDYKTQCIGIHCIEFHFMYLTFTQKIIVPIFSSSTI